MRISVIIPCFNVENYIDRCLTSIEQQTVGIEQFEIILVDDCSVDDTLSKLKAFEQKYEANTVLIPCEENVGAAEARNIGLMYATGDYITFIDADDYIANTMFEKMVASLEVSQCEMVECLYQEFSEESVCETRVVGQERVYNLFNPSERKNYIVNYGLKSAVWGRMYRKDFFDRTGLRFIAGAIYEDVQFSGVAMFLLQSVCVIPETLYFYYSNENGITRTPNREKLKQEVEIIHLMLEELDDRGMIKDVMDSYYEELEYYCILKSYMDPISMLVSSKGDSYNDDVNFYRKQILDIFPNAGNNAYGRAKAESSQFWDIMMSLLQVQEKIKTTTSMVTVKIIGGLGNQMRCYCAGYMVSKLLNVPLTVDITDFYLGYFRQYLLDYLNVPQMLRLWHSIDIPAYSDVVNLPRIAQGIYDLYLNLDTVNSKEELQEKLQGHSSVYLFGYDENHLFESDLELYRNLLQPRFDNMLYKYFKSEIKEKNSVSVHVRRTDFVSLNWSSDGTLDFYLAAMNYVRCKIERPCFYIFSDDIEWCRKQFSNYTDCFFVDSFGGEVQSLYDMYCMAECKYHIVTKKSTYSKWASLLCENQNSFTICEKSENVEEGSREYGKLNVIFLNHQQIAEYKDQKKAYYDAEVSVPNASTCFSKLEDCIINGRVENAICVLNQISVGRNFHVSASERDSLLDYRGLLYFLMGKYEMALDSFRALKGKRKDYEFLYNYAMCLEMTGHHTEALCYAAIAKVLLPESDIDTCVCVNNDEEHFLWETFTRAYLELCVNASRNIIILSDASPESIRKQIVSIAELLSNLGFNSYVWKRGMSSIEELKGRMNFESIFVTNIYENCIDFETIGLPIIAYLSVGNSDVDCYWSRQYSQNQIAEMKEKANIFLNNQDNISIQSIKLYSNASVGNRNQIAHSDDLVLTWDTCVNDEEYIWMCGLILDGIVKTLL